MTKNVVVFSDEYVSEGEKKYVMSRLPVGTYVIFVHEHLLFSKKIFETINPKDWFVIILGLKLAKKALGEVQTKAFIGTQFEVGNQSALLADFTVLFTYDFEHIRKVYSDRIVMSTHLSKVLRPFSCEVPQVLTNPTIDQYIVYCESLISAAERDEEVLLCVDIEGYVNNMTVLSLCDNGRRAVVVGLNNDTMPSMCIEDECAFWLYSAKVLQNPKIKKIMHNHTYDCSVLLNHGIAVQGMYWDTMYAQRMLYPEFEMNLGFVVSLWLNVPPWKHQIGTDTLQYAGRDTIYPWQVAKAQQAMMSEDEKKFMAFMLKVGEFVVYVQLKGIRLNTQARQKAVTNARYLRSFYYFLLGVLTSDECAELINHPSLEKALVQKLHKNWGLKKSICPTTLLALVSCVKKPFQEAVETLANLFTTNLREKLPTVFFGEIFFQSRLAININSSAQLQDFLYKDLGLPEQTQYNKDKDETALSCNQLALLNLLIKPTGEEVLLRTLLAIRTVDTELEALEAPIDDDGFIRCSLNPAGTETIRTSCSKSLLNKGYNLQTATPRYRYIFIPDNPDDQWCFQSDLEGADGVTVAAECYLLGDPTMWDDFAYGLKPAKIVCLAYLEGANWLKASRKDLLEATKRVSKDHPFYITAKRIQHGTNYDMTDPTVQSLLIRDTYKANGSAILTDIKVCSALRNLYTSRYPGVVERKKHFANQLLSAGKITYASGLKRSFFNRIHPSGPTKFGVVPGTLKECLASTPQFNTTWITNRAAVHFFNSPKNKRKDGSLIVDIRLPIHDAIFGMFPKDQLELFTELNKEAFDQPFEINGLRVKIGVETKYGPSWGELKHSVKTK
jgi:DNA polymerase I-like protein with 3'-5' exonuclease and polymerase domains